MVLSEIPGPVVRFSGTALLGADLVVGGHDAPPADDVQHLIHLVGVGLGAPARLERDHQHLDLVAVAVGHQPLHPDLAIKIAAHRRVFGLLAIDLPDLHTLLASPGFIPYIFNIPSINRTTL